jgi:hypothetical protein
MRFAALVAHMCLVHLFLAATAIAEQRPSFVDGFHGGVEGH